MNYEAFFRAATDGHRPYPYQERMAADAWPETRIIPTGFGKTAAVLGAWIWKTASKDPDTPRRLVYCLPMRTLVEQTERVARIWIKAAREALPLEVHLDVLMGGRGEERRRTPDWIMSPERPTILIGTQDILVSAALMRGYGVSRYRWPVDFALLHNDALWVFDEVQLTGAAIATSAQLEAFRRAFGCGRPSRTLWMSATLDPQWLKTVDFEPTDKARPHDLSNDDLSRAKHLWNARKKLTSLDLSNHDLIKKEGKKTYAAAIAKAALEHVRGGTNTIVFLNTVARAQAVFDALRANDGAWDTLLIHSRFRAADRAVLTAKLSQEPSAAGRIIVATQALEAGVDVTSSVMLSELAPWSSLVQRFGRCNRYGECGEAGAQVLWIDLSDEAAAPYSAHELEDARKKLKDLEGCGPDRLASIPPSAPADGHVIRKRDLLDLFDTDPDLSGFDVDVSPYVRDSNDTDLRVFWRPVDESAPPPDASEPSRDELCPAPIGQTKEFLKRKGVRAWRWDGLAYQWQSIRADEVFPGLTIWVDAASGGYDPIMGFEPSSNVPVHPIVRSEPEPSSVEGDPDAYTSTVRVSLAKHSIHVRDQVVTLAGALGLSEAQRTLVTNVACWHDLGKAHEAFVALTRSALINGVAPPLAKWPSPMKGEPPPKRLRRYFRHELASALGFLVHHNWSAEASLAAYLIAAHHGKVRMRLRALPNEPNPGDDRLFARGVWDHDVIPATRLGELDVPETVLDLDIMQLGDGKHGPSWSTRTQSILNEYLPFRLAWLEAVIRIADWRASDAEEGNGHDDL
jgi:CRISPR-associated endonuclease/helicase Cas3